MTRTLSQLALAFSGAYLLAHYLPSDNPWLVWLACALWGAIVALAFAEFWPDKIGAIVRAIKQAALPDGYQITHVAGFEAHIDGRVQTEIRVMLQQKNGPGRAEGRGPNIQAAIADAVADVGRRATQ